MTRCASREPLTWATAATTATARDGTVYEAAMTAAGTFPTQETEQKVQANVVAAKYDVPRLSLAPASAVATPPGLQTFSPGSSQDTTVTFKNYHGAACDGRQVEHFRARGLDLRGFRRQRNVKDVRRSASRRARP